MTLQGRRGFVQTVRVPSYGEEGWPNRHIAFIVAEKAYFTVPLALFTVYVGEGWLKTPEYRHMEGRGLKL